MAYWHFLVSSLSKGSFGHTLCIGQWSDLHMMMMNVLVMKMLLRKSLILMWAKCLSHPGIHWVIGFQMDSKNLEECLQELDPQQVRSLCDVKILFVFSLILLEEMETKSAFAHTKQKSRLLNMKDCCSVHLKGVLLSWQDGFAITILGHIIVIWLPLIYFYCKAL